MKLLILILALLVETTPLCFSQIRQDVNRVFERGMYSQEGLLGFWVIKPDNQFVFLDFQRNFLHRFGRGE